MAVSSDQEEPNRQQSGWTKTESLIALFSVILAAIGSISSATSSYLTYKQLNLFNKERITPYRAILYDKKLVSYQTLAEQNSDYIPYLKTFTRSRILDGIIFKNEPEFSSSKNSKYKYALAQDLKSILENNRKLQSIIIQIDPIWDNRIRNTLTGMDGDLINIEFCIYQYQEMLNSDANTSNVELEESSCTQDGLQKTVDGLDQKLSAAILVMRKNLQADRLQSIESE